MFAKHLQSVARFQYQKNFPLPESEVKTKRAAAALPGIISSERKFKLVSGNESLPIEKQVMTATFSCRTALTKLCAGNCNVNGIWKQSSESSRRS